MISVSFYISFFLFIILAVYKISRWFFVDVNLGNGEFSSSGRIWHACIALVTSFFSLQVFKLIASLFIDIFFQWRILKRSPIRWVSHMLIFYGFFLLLFMHALDDFVSASLFSDYEPTLSPYLFLRNLFGFMVLIGVAIAAWRRYASARLKRITRRGDWFALILLIIIVLSGFFLEASKIISENIFNRMVDDYAPFIEDEDQSVPSLRALWVKEYGLAAAVDAGPVSYDIDQGREINEENCAYCHAKSYSAFVSYPLSRVMKPVSGICRQIHLKDILWYLHFFSCMIGLAILPFTKFFHIFATPVSLFIRNISRSGSIKTVNIATLMVINLDACTNCGECSHHCSVAPLFDMLLNPNILPSEKLFSVKKSYGLKKIPLDQLGIIAEGTYMCTDCSRCTMICPSGLDLAGLWAAMKDDLAGKGFLPPSKAIPFAFGRNWKLPQPPRLLNAQDKDADVKRFTEKWLDSGSFSMCFSCRTCTSICPVVACTENPSETLGLVPNAIMHALSMGLLDMALDSRMIWDCTTCYLCQELCPQGVAITDIFHDLKNLVYNRVKNGVEPAGTEKQQYDAEVI